MSAAENDGSPPPKAAFNAAVRPFSPPVKAPLRAADRPARLALRLPDSAPESDADSAGKAALKLAARFCPALSRAFRAPWNGTVKMPFG